MSGVPVEIAAMAASLRKAPAQLAMLRRAVASNGGGLNGFSEPRRVWEALYAKDLVQGKSGLQCCIVHTRLGLAVIRHIDAEAGK